jgi:serine protease inhibitor
MRSHLKKIAILGCTVLLLWSTSAFAQQTKDSMDLFKKVHTQFAFDIFKYLLNTNMSENLLFSPLGLYFNLCSIQSGARGEVFFNIEDKMGHALVSPEKLFPYFTGLNNELSRPPVSTMLKVSSQLWIKSGILIRPEFGKTVSGMFATDTKPFSAGVPLGHQTKDFLGLSSVTFKSRFLTPFLSDKTSDKPFYTLDGATITTPMMSQDGAFLYLRGNGFQAVLMPLSGKKMSMYIFLPENSLRSFLGKLSFYSWDRWLSQFKLRQGTVMLPRCTVKSETDYTASLKYAGLSSLFSTRADYTGIIGGGKIRLNAVLQKNESSFEDVKSDTLEEEPQVDSQSGEKPFRFTANKPFLFVVRDNATGEIVLMGLVTSPG